MCFHQSQSKSLGLARHIILLSLQCSLKICSNISTMQLNLRKQLIWAWTRCLNRLILKEISHDWLLEDVHLTSFSKKRLLKNLELFPWGANSRQTKFNHEGIQLWPSEIINIEIIKFKFAKSFLNLKIIKKIYLDLPSSLISSSTSSS